MAYRSLLFLLLFGFYAAGAQPVLYHPGYRSAEVEENGNMLRNPFAGGLVNPQFSPIDLNGDGQEDLVVFEPIDAQVLTFIYIGFGTYVYNADYESAFPKMSNWMLLRDYDKDGKADLFTYSRIGGGMDVYKNVSEGNKPAFKKIAQQLYYQDEESRLNLYVPATDVPVITDMDGDGDLDVLAFDVFQSFVQYYVNRSMDKYGTADSLDFAINDRCWGKFQLSASDNSVEMGINCGTVHVTKKKEHGGSTMLAIDLDGDGDKDLLLSDVNYANIFELENGRIRAGKPTLARDSVVAVDTVWPNTAQRASIPYFPACFLVDVNHDGKQDILVSPQQMYESQDHDQVFHYTNTGTAQNPVYSLIENDFLQNTMVQYGMHTAPALQDMNGDGLPDLLLATEGNTQGKYQYDKLILYLNTGTAGSPVFSKRVDDYAGLLQRKAAYMKPCLGDLNGDGLPDMLVGSEDGKLLYYKNTGLSNGIPQMSLQDTNFEGITAGQYSAPCIVDMDKDGLPDLLLGKYNGTISYYRNTGTKSQPAFTLITDTLGGVHTNHYYYEYIYDQVTGELIDSTLRKDPFGGASPVAADLDGDGKLDLVTGSKSQGLYFYFNIEDKLGGSFTRTDSLYYNKIFARREERRPGINCVPAVAKLDKDSLPDLLVGNLRGGLYYYTSQEDPTDVRNEKRASVPGFQVYPNPAMSSVTIGLDRNIRQSGTLQLMSVLGQVLASQAVSSRETQLQLDLSHLPEGVYLLRLRCADGSVSTQKLVIRR